MATVDTDAGPVTINCIDALSCTNEGGRLDPVTRRCARGTCGGHAEELGTCSVDADCAGLKDASGRTLTCVPFADSCHERPLPGADGSDLGSTRAGSATQCQAADKSACVVPGPNASRCTIGTDSPLWESCSQPVVTAVISRAARHTSN